MAQFTLDSAAVMSRLTLLMTRLAGAIEWVGLHPHEITIEVLEEIWQHYGGPQAPRKVGMNCLCAALPQERAEAEILLGLLSKMGERGTRRPRVKRRR